MPFHAPSPYVTWPSLVTPRCSLSSSKCFQITKRCVQSLTFSSMSSLILFIKCQINVL